MFVLIYSSLNCNLVLRCAINKKVAGILRVFQCRVMHRGNQNGSGKYDDSLNWFDMMSRENPLLSNQFKKPTNALALVKYYVFGYSTEWEANHLTVISSRRVEWSGFQVPSSLSVITLE